MNMKKVLIVCLLALGIFGCDAGSTRNSTYEEVPAEQQGSNSITIEAGGDVVIKDTIVTGEGTYIECGEGGCGDINIVGGDQYYDRIDSGTTGAATNQGGDGTCPAGYVYCSIEDKCVPSKTASPCGS